MFTNKYAEGVIATVPTGEACGYALFSMSFSPWYGLPVMNIIDVFCSPQVAANSLDRQLFSALCTVASERKCCRLEWRVNKVWVLACTPANSIQSNQEQIQLAEKIGAMPLEGSELVMIEGEENITQLARLTDQPLPGWK